MTNRPEQGNVSTGVCDNPTFFTKALQGTTLYHKPLVFALNHGIFTGMYDDVTVPMHIYLFTYGRFLGGNIPTDDLQIRAVVLGEMLGWMKPTHNGTDHITVDEADAREKYKKAVARLYNCPNPPSYVRERITADKADATKSPIIASAIAHYDNNAAGAPPALDAAFTFVYAYNLVTDLISTIPQNRMIPQAWAAAHAIVAFGKRGTVSPQYVNKITEACTVELGYSHGIDADLIALFWSSYGRALNADTAQLVAERWSRYIPANALRLSIVLQQAANSGLTSIITIGRALKAYPTFPWAKMRRLYPTEFANATTAFREINNNPYYGYNQSSTPASSTKFKNLAYWCKEIIIRIDGDNALARYKGWTRTPTHSNAVTHWIDEYANQLAQAANVEANEADREAFEELTAAIGRNDRLFE